MSRHEYFDELCALSATGQLSREDERLLREHLKQCSDCRQASQDFASILQELSPTSHAPVDRAILLHADDKALRQRFLNRARAEGHRFSQDSLEGPSTTKPWFSRLVPWFQFAAVGIAAAIVASVLIHRTIEIGRRESRTTSVFSTTTATVGSRPTLVVNDGIPPKLTELESLKEESQQTIKSLNMGNANIAARLDALEKQNEAIRADRDELQKVLIRTSDMNSQLTRQIEHNDQTVAQTAAELEKTRADGAAVAAELASESMKVNELSEQVRLQRASVDQYSDLLVADRDITDLMGARNLHIIDVHDADGNGKDLKSFGRVFYTEGKSLIFYAFDLDDKKLANAKYTFEAWGERLGEPASAKSLGILYSDDKAQRRWVLKVDDPRQLGQINALFVTLEPREGESGKPRGKKILYAFLGGQANHP